MIRVLSGGAAAARREIGVNVLAHGADPTGTAASDDAFAAAAQAVRAGLTGTGKVLVPAGVYTFEDTLDEADVVFEGEGLEASILKFPTDLGIHRLGYRGSGIVRHGLRNLWVWGPDPAAGLVPRLMDGIRVGGGGMFQNVRVSGFRGGLKVDQDHEVYDGVIAGGNAWGILWGDTETGGDQTFRGIETSGCYIAAMAVAPNNGGPGGVLFDKCQFGGMPVVALKLKLGSGEDGISDYSYTGTVTTTNGSALLTLSTVDRAEWMSRADAHEPKRIAGDGIAPGTQITHVNGIAEAGYTNNADGANTIRLTAAATASASGVTVYIATRQNEMFSAATFSHTSMESYGYAVFKGDGEDYGSSITLDRPRFVNIFHANPFDVGIRNATLDGLGFEPRSAFQDVGFRSMEMLGLDGAPLLPGTEAVFDYLGANCDLGDMSAVIGTCREDATKFALDGFPDGTRFICDGVSGGVFLMDTAVEWGDVVCVLDIRARKTNGTNPPLGVALLDGDVDDIVPVALGGGTGSAYIKVHSSNAGTLASPGTTMVNKYLKVDTVNLGCVQIASGPTDGQVIAVGVEGPFATDADSPYAGMVRATLRGLA